MSSLSDLDMQRKEVISLQNETPLAHLRSQDVIVQAPFSYAGSTLRIMRAFRPMLQGAVARLRGSNSVPAKIGNGFLVGLAYSLVYTVLVLAWAGVTVWYATFGLLLVPYRLIRRSDRNRKRQQLQHEELIAASIAAASVAQQRD